MEKFTKWRKNFKFDIRVWMNIFISGIFVAIFCLIYLNQMPLNFYANGFYQLFKDELQVYYLDVGQASASLIIFPTGSTMIIDTGSQSSEEQFMESVDFILSKNSIKEIDYLILTHSDEDHVGGTMALLEKYQVYHIYRPKLLSISDLEVENEKNYRIISTIVYEKAITSIYNEPNASVEFIEDEVLFFGDSTVLQIFSCKQDRYSDTNSYCPFITIENNDYTFMFTGDATKTREVEFAQTIELEEISIKVDFLAVAHHGSSYSTTLNFLDCIQPTYAFISAGDSTHPTTETLQKLNMFVKEIFCTKEQGILAVGISEDCKYSIKTLQDNFDFPLIVVVLFLSLCATINFNNNLKKYKYIKRFYRK